MAQTSLRPSSQVFCSSADLLVGPSAAMAHLWSQIRRVAPYFRTALVTGERGAGAEAAAHALHQLSPLAARTFLVMTPQDAEVQLTASSMPRLAGEMLFLPEVERLSPAAQQGLLRLLKVRRPKPVCVIASATGDLRPLVSAGQFSGALAQALGGLQLVVPPLRDRREDVPVLAEHLLQAEAKAMGLVAPVLRREVFEKLAEERWPGNLQQMKAVLRELVVRPDAEVEALVRASDMQAEEPGQTVRLMKLEQVVQEHIRAVLLRCNGNKLKAAEVLGISRSTLYRMLETPPMAA